MTIPKRSPAGASTRSWRPRKSLGQNFLVDRAICRKIVDAFGPGSDETVMEIGPGQAALTGLLCERAARVVAVEYDREMARTLPTRVASERLVVVERDVLQVDFRALADEFGVRRWPVVGNLPYVISSRLIMRLIEQAPSIQRATMMVQREVGERFLAGPGSRTYGLLSVLLQGTGRLRRGFRVGPDAFRPRPTVQSFVFTWESDPPADLNIRGFIRTAKAAFGQRRKRLDNALKQLAGADEASIADACDVAGVEPGLRAEHLAPADFIRLAGAFERIGVIPAGAR